MQKILIVEDDIDIQDILKNHLIDVGYEVAVASDGVAGIAMFDDTIDLVLLDIMLPKIDGYGVCEVIRKRSQIPIIMLTALSDEENQLRGFEQQIDDYIPKPFSPKILLCKIAAILRRRTAENQNPSAGLHSVRERYLKAGERTDYEHEGRRRKIFGRFLGQSGTPLLFRTDRLHLVRGHGGRKELHHASGPYQCQ